MYTCTDNPNYNDEVAHQYHQLAPSPVDTTPPSPPPAQDQMHYEFAQDSVKIAHSYEYAICGSDDTSVSNTLKYVRLIKQIFRNYGNV